MKQIKNIAISERSDASLQQGESCFKYLLLGFLALCWLCKTNALETAEVHQYRVAAVGNVPVQDESDPLGCGDHWPCVLGWHP